tara:strand:+ start:4439 stop:4852 length:414 start_codon:yes stop_codon:yes gene_type:complete
MGIEIDHIGIAVNNLDNRTPFWVALGLILGEDEDLPNDGVVARFLSTSGESDIAPRIELLQATGPETPIGRFIERRGEGIQQIAFRVDDIQSTIEILMDNGVNMIDENPRKGAHGSLIAFVHPKSTGGVLVEIVQRT